MKNKIIGITGIIGSGKSTVANIIREMNYLVLNADDIAKDIMVQNETLKAAIIEEFGSDSYQKDGSLNRVYLAELVFGNPKDLEKLNDLVHPLVRNFFGEKSQVNDTKDNLVFWDVPLLFEGELWEDCAEIILVSADKKIRLERSVETGRFSLEDFEKRESEQIPLIEKRKKSDYIIDNSGAVSSTKEQVGIIIRKIISVSKDA